MDPFRIGHRPQAEQASLAASLLSRTSQPIQQVVKEGRIPKPRPLILMAKQPDALSTPENILFKQAITTLEVACDIQTIIQDKAAVDRGQLLGRLIEGRDTLPKLYSTERDIHRLSGFEVVDSTEGGKNSGRFQTKVSRGDIPTYIVKSIVSLTGYISRLLLEMEDSFDEPNFLAVLQDHFGVFLSSLVKALPDQNNKVRFTQVIGIVNRYNYAPNPPPAMYRFDQKALLLTIEVDAKSAQDFIKKPAAWGEQIDFGFTMSSAMYNFEPKRWEGSLKAKYNDALQALVGKGLDEFGGSLLKDVKLDIPV